MGFVRKLARSHVWERIFYERLTEPLHLNAISLLVAAFGSFRAKVKWDLVVRPHNAYGILKAASEAAALGHRKVALLEFGVATGAGLVNMAEIADRASRETGVDCRVYGFDTGGGMPPPRDYRDHPDLYTQGDFKMDREALESRLPSRAKLVIGPVAETVPAFLDALPADEPVGYAVVDVDYYYSAAEALAALAGAPAKYLPLVPVYLDDIWCERHNSACGELLAAAEFNRVHPMRRLEPHAFFANSRVFTRARWLKQMHFLHVLDHPARARSGSVAPRALENPYL